MLLILLLVRQVYLLIWSKAVSSQSEHLRHIWEDKNFQGNWVLNSVKGLVRRLC